MALFWLSDEAWAAIEPHLPKSSLARDALMIAADRRHPACLEGRLPLVRLPSRLWSLDYRLQPLRPWSRRGFGLKLLDALVETGAVAQSTAIDSTHVKAQRAAFGGKGGARRRRSAARAGGWTTKVHALTDVIGRPLNSGIFA